MKILRWLLCIPVGLLGGWTTSGLILLLGDFLVGGWQVPSGIIIYFAAACVPGISLGIGLRIAPRNRAAKWLLLSPHLLWAVFFGLPILIGLLFTGGIATDSTTLKLSRSLSLPWQLGLWITGYCASVAYGASQKVEELLPESSEATEFRRLYGVGLRSPNTDEQIAAARQALKGIDTLNPWPFPPNILLARVARGKLLGSLAKAYIDIKSRDPVTFSKLALAALEEAEMFLGESDGEDWAILKMNGSVIYAESALGDRGENLERAIESVEAALSRLDRTQHAETWCQAKGNLAGFLAERKIGDPADNLERALSAQQDMLDAISPETSPHMWSIARAGLGALYLRRLRGPRKENVASAVSLLEEALGKTSRSKAAFDWAHTAVFLASAYGDSVLARDHRSIERARGLLMDAIEVYDTLKNWERWAGAQINLGVLWSEDAGSNRLDAIEKAIHCFEQALTVFTAESFPSDHALALTNLAAARKERRTAGRSENVEIAVAEARAASVLLNKDTMRRDWARARSTLGLTLLEQHGGDRSMAVEEAISCFQDTLSVVSEKSEPEAWAMAMGNLANAFAVRVEGDPVENVEKAIRLQERAIKVLDPTNYPNAWTGAVHNLAVSYSERMMGSHADNIEMAIALVNLALVMRPAMHHPAEHSELLELLGSAYLERLRGDSGENLENALYAFRAARRLRIREAGTVEWLRLDQKLRRAQARIQDLASGTRSKGASEPVDVDQFMKEMETEAQAISPDDHLPTWVNGQIALGDMYSRIAPAETTAARSLAEAIQKNIHKALEVYKNTLARMRRSREPRLWALVQKRICTAYQMLSLFVDWRRRAQPTEDHDTEALVLAEERSRRALDAAAEALADALEAAPFDPREVLSDAVRLGRLHVEREDWDQAKQAFASASRAAEALLGDVELNEQETRFTLRSMGELATLAPYTFVITGDIEQALETAEAAKARLLAKALTLEALDLSPEKREYLEDLQGQIAAHEAKLTSPVLVDRMPPLDAVMRCREELNHFAGGRAATSAAQWIREIVADGAVLVFPFLTDVGTCLVIAFYDAGETRTAHVVIDDALGTRHPFLRSRGPAGLDWREPYTRYQNGSKVLNQWAWNRLLRTVGENLGAVLAQPLVQLLEANGLKTRTHLHIMAQGSLGNLPIGVAGDQGSDLALLDRFVWSLAPSLRVLAAAKASRRAEERSRTLALFTCGTDLQFLDFEAEMVRSRFDDVAWLAGDRATKLQSLGILENRTVWHFAAHGVFEPDRPGFSGIDLANGERLTVDELITSRRLAKPSLVVLAACMTGLYDQEGLPNEFIGLPAAFLQAGAAGVVGTLWQVNDVPSALLLSRFYEAYAEKGLTPCEALHHAQRWLRDTYAADLRRTVERWAQEGRLSEPNAVRMLDAITLRENDSWTPLGPVFASPSHWSGFVYYGA